MRFMLLVIPKGYENAPANETPDPEGIARMMKFNESLHQAGILLSLDGLEPPATGARVRFKDGKATVTDGPFAEAKEVLGGYWMIDVKSREEAIAWASKAPMGDDELIEVRKVQDIADWPEDARRAAEGYEEMQQYNGRR